MTYYESFSSARNITELCAMVKENTSVAIFLGANPDRIKAIEDAMNRVANERGWKLEALNENDN